MSCGTSATRPPYIVFDVARNKAPDLWRDVSQIIDELSGPSKP